jgi:cobalamin biosynthesis protein CobD/CbiB
LAEVHRKAEKESTIWRGLMRALAILATAAPIWAFQEVVDPLAGRETIVQVNVVLSVTIALSLVVNVAQQAKIRSQRDELKRQRERLKELEGGQA